MAYVYVNPYKSSYLAARVELGLCQRQLAHLTQRIAQLTETIKTLEPLANEGGVPPTAGLPELCRQILMSQPSTPFSAGDVMQHLAQMGIDINNYSNPLAVLHTTLGRLVRRGNGFGKDSDGKNPIYMYDESFLDDAHRSGMRGMK
jgi:Mg2+ and Co2+ transporter CorA